jgi:uncharacterized protein YkwD
MLLRARKRRRFAVRASTLLLVGAAVVALPATASAALVPPSGAQATAASACRGAGSTHASKRVLRRAILCLVNRTRASAGLARFRAERHLARAAVRHAADMGRRHYFAHVSPSGTSPLARARAAGWHGGVGEVIAWGSGSMASPRAALTGWLNSPPHRAILLGGAHRAGVGVKHAGGRTYWVIDVG